MGIMQTIVPWNPNARTTNLVMDFEGYGKKLPNGNCIAYLDTLANKRSWSPGYSGLWTIGYGATGTTITEGTIWTKQQAINDLNARLKKHAAEVRAYLGPAIWDSLNANQQGALTSLSYNVGTGGIHDILNLIKNGDIDDAANAFPNYNHSDGVVIDGLTRRRLAEKELFEWEVPAEVADMSPIMSLTQWSKRATAGVTISSVSMFAFIQNAQQIVVNNAGWILLGIGCSVFLVLHLIQKSTQTAFDSGEYIPLGTKPVDVVPPEIAAAPIVPTHSTTIITPANNNAPVTTPAQEAA